MKSILNNPYYQHMHMEMNKKFGTDSQTNRVFGWRCGANFVGADPLLICLDEGQRKRSGSRRAYSRKMRVCFARRISRNGANPDGFRRRPSRRRMSTTAVFPTPASPMRTGLFLV